MGGTGIRDVMHFETFAGFMTELSVEYIENSAFDYMIRFTTTHDFEEIYKNTDSDKR